MTQDEDAGQDGPAAGTFGNQLFAGQQIAVIGGTSGIGAAVAAYFTTLGASVIAAGLGADAAPPEPGGARVTELDVTDAGAVSSFFGGLRELHVLVNCAGIIDRGREFDLAVFARVLDRVRVNAVAPGWIRTPLTADLAGSAERSAALLARTPLGRWGNRPILRRSSRSWPHPPPGSSRARSCPWTAVTAPPDPVGSRLTSRERKPP